ncbi:phasin family protein [Sandarakinorhabdus rubra]|uniref:phasin family protein n=1 Tax=Sandarakinorhabdus rubra TaxID=2672568 RepID=UPI0013DAE312|nr:phasin family protein [Sandarakinorhabdus rubra]
MTAKPPAAKSKPVAKRAPAGKAAAPVVTVTEAAAPTIESPPVPAMEAVVDPVVTETVAEPVPEVVAETVSTLASETADEPTPEPAPQVAGEPATTPVASGGLVIPFATVFNAATPFVKEPLMATAFETTQDAVRTTVETINAQTEAAVNNGKAAMEQVAAKSKEAVEASMKSLDELNDMARANIDALIASARVATTGVEQVMNRLTEVSKASFEETTAMVKKLAAAKTPNELMQLQSDFAKAQFDSAVAEYSKLTEMMVKLAGDVMEPVQNQVAVATDKMKAAWTAK